MRKVLFLSVFLSAGIVATGFVGCKKSSSTSVFTSDSIEVTRLSGKKIKLAVPGGLPFRAPVSASACSVAVNRVDTAWVGNTQVVINIKKEQIPINYDICSVYVDKKIRSVMKIGAKKDFSIDCGLVSSSYRGNQHNVKIVICGKNRNGQQERLYVGEELFIAGINNFIPSEDLVMIAPVMSKTPPKFHNIVKKED